MTHWDHFPRALIVNPKVEAARFSSFQLGENWVRPNPSKEGLPASLMWLFPSAQHCCPKRSWRRWRKSVPDWMIFRNCCFTSLWKENLRISFQSYSIFAFACLFWAELPQQPLETWSAGLQDALRGQSPRVPRARAPVWSVAFWSLDLIHWRFLFISGRDGLEWKHLPEMQSRR